jgi:hypothetical protein
MERALRSVWDDPDIADITVQDLAGDYPTIRDGPVHRFHDLDDARRALWVAGDDPALANRIRRLWRFSARLVRASAARGVRRFRTIEEANAERERRIHDRVQALLAERAGSG